MRNSGETPRKLDLIPKFLGEPFQKEGYHVDKIWQYSLANSSDGYGLQVESTRSSKTKNESKGLSKETFVNLMTVQEDELFDFSHIWNNAKMDTKGPLGNLPLFLISSFSLNHFSKWQMFLVNIISFVIIQVFLFKISFLITNKKIVSFLIIAFYGFSQAGINTVVFLRMYGKIDKPRKRNNVFDGQHQDEFSPYAIFDYIEYIAYYAKDYIKDYYNGFLGHYRCAFKKIDVIRNNDSSNKKFFLKLSKGIVGVKYSCR